MIEVFKRFTFDAAHHLGANVPEGHIYSRMHGHSFSVTVFLRGEPDPTTGWLVDFGVLEKAVMRVHEQIDHRLLNDIKGLEIPTLENISHWIWEYLSPDFPSLHRISVERQTLGQGCSYEATP